MAQREFRQIFPQPGWVEHDPKEIWDTPARHRARGARQGRAAAPPTSPPSASPTSARPRCCGTARTGAADRTTPSSGRTGAPSRCARSCASAGWSRPVRAQHRADHRRLLLRHQAALAARPRARRARAAARGELAFGTVDSWLMWKLTGGARACHRREQRLAHDAVRHPPQRLGRRAAAGCCTCPHSVLPQVHPSSHVFGHTRRRRCSARRSRSPASPATSRARCSARPASRPAWRRTPTAPAASC